MLFTACNMSVGKGIGKKSHPKALIFVWAKVASCKLNKKQCVGENMILKAPVNIDKAFFIISVVSSGLETLPITSCINTHKMKVLLQQQMILRQRKVGVTFQLLHRFHSLSAWFFLWTLKEVVLLLRGFKN